MINFRYHIVSLTAIFLALGIGIAMGSTVVSKATVTGLKNNLSTVEHRSDATSDENRRLQGLVDRLTEQDRALVTQALPAAVSDRLTGVPVVVIASKGIDGRSLSDLQGALADAGARYEGTLEVDKRLVLSGGNADKMAKLLAVDADSDLRGLLVDRLATVLAEAAATPSRVAPTSPPTTAPPPPGTDPVGPTTTTIAPVGAPTQPALVTALREQGFLDFVPPDGGSSDDLILTSPAGGYRYVLVSGPNPDVPDDDFLVPLIRALTDRGPAPVVAASAATGKQAEDERMSFLGPLRSDRSLDGLISTVDDLERYPGLLATVYALADLDPGGQGRHGDYGVGEGASALVPSVSG